jgi:hypothetical protein
MLRTIEIDLTYQPTIDGPPQQQGNLFNKAASNDDVTIKHWRDTWLKHAKANFEKHGDFGNRSIGSLYGANKHKPCIVLGSGPSLKQSIETLKKNAAREEPVMTVSCLHNFGYFEDEGFHADYYLSLDAGKIVMADISEGRKQSADFYWEKTKGKKLLVVTTTDPELLEKWQGEIYWFTVMIPDHGVQTELNAICRFTHFVSCGGNALGACLYIAKCCFGSDPIIIVGGDFCFDYNNQFHSYATHYDTAGTVVPMTDVFGNTRKCWPSYMNFKYWFDWVACTIPGNYISSSEGIMGAYKEGNIKQFKYMPLEQALLPYSSSEKMFLQEMDAISGKVTNKTEFSIKDYWANPKYEKDLLLF